jgi:hypothetical protein
LIRQRRGPCRAVAPELEALARDRAGAVFHAPEMIGFRR